MSEQNLLPHIDSINERLRRLEAYAEKVGQMVGVPFGSPAAEVPADVVALARANRRIEAIKRYRELTGVGLDEARRIVLSI